MTEHLQIVAMKDHMRNIHRNILTRPKIIKNVYCIKKFDNVKEHKLYEVSIIHILYLIRKWVILYFFLFLLVYFHLIKLLIS